MFGGSGFCSVPGEVPCEDISFHQDRWLFLGKYPFLVLFLRLAVALVVPGSQGSLTAVLGGSGVRARGLQPILCVAECSLPAPAFASLPGDGSPRLPSPGCRDCRVPSWYGAGKGLSPRGHRCPVTAGVEH